MDKNLFKVKWQHQNKQLPSLNLVYDIAENRNQNVNVKIHTYMESRSLEYKFTRQLFKNLQQTEMSYCQAPSPNIADNYI